jgi:hypothetical protein
MTSEWRSVFHGLYEVSDIGEVRRAVDGVNTHSGRILTPSLSTCGYIKFKLHRDGKGFNKYAHRLVAEAFIGSIGEKLQINHKDGNKTNNCVDNLEIVTASENGKHATAMGLNKPPTRRLYGDEHWTRAKPHLLARGDRNGAKTKPENTLKGSQCPSSKLVESQVIEIKQMIRDGIHKQVIADKFNVTRTNIYYIATGKSWKQVK